MKQDLSILPRHIVKSSKKWFQNTKTGKFIPAARILDYLPKPEPDHETIISKRYDLREN